MRMWNSFRTDCVKLRHQSRKLEGDPYSISSFSAILTSSTKAGNIPPTEESSRRAQSRSIIDGARKMLPASPATSLSGRSEEHTSELQSLMRISYAAFRLKQKHISICLSHTLTQLTHTNHA